MTLNSSGAEATCLSALRVWAMHHPGQRGAWPFLYKLAREERKMSAMKELSYIKDDLYGIVNHCIDCRCDPCVDCCAMGLQMELDCILLEAFEMGRDYYEKEDQGRGHSLSSRKAS